MTIPRHQGDSLIVDVTVEENGSAKNITGGTVEAAVRSPTDTDTTVTALITDAANGVVRFTCPKAVLNVVGPWLGELELVIGSESQTVWQETIQVSQAILTD